MVVKNHKPRWHVSEKQRSNARAVRREMTEAERIICCNIRFNHLDMMKNKAGVLEQIAVALSGSQTFCRILRRTRQHAGREDVP